MVDELKILEKRMANRYMEDGIWDIYLGLMAFAFGFGIVLDISYLAAIMVSVGFAFQSIAKNMITFPRIGYIKLRKAKKRGMAAVLTGVLFLGMMIFLVFMLGDENPVRYFVRDRMLFFIAVIWGGAIALAGLSFHVRRYFAYALIVFGAVMMSEWMGSLGLNLIGAGLLVMIAGLFVMMRFIRKYPITPQQN